MIKPSEIDTSRYFMGSAFRNSERETIARNITLLSQAMAYANNDDRWPKFTRDDYITYRNATSNEPVSPKELAILGGFTNDKFLEIIEPDTMVVTNNFLGVVAQFVRPEAAEQVIAR